MRTDGSAMQEKSRRRQWSPRAGLRGLV